MKNDRTTIDFLSGLAPTQEQIGELSDLIQHLLNLPAFADKKPCTVLNALLFAYWTAAHMSGMEAQAADGMVQIGGRYLAALAMAQHAAASTDKPVVH